jgi:hypothetical protein
MFKWTIERQVSRIVLDIYTPMAYTLVEGGVNGDY